MSGKNNSEHTWNEENGFGEFMKSILFCKFLLLNLIFVNVNANIYSKFILRFV
jgi:hypothetical protein